jgi:hypothetical protein
MLFLRTPLIFFIKVNNFSTHNDANSRDTPLWRKQNSKIKLEINRVDIKMEQKNVHTWILSIFKQMGALQAIWPIFDHKSISRAILNIFLYSKESYIIEYCHNEVKNAEKLKFTSIFLTVLANYMKNVQICIESCNRPLDSVCDVLYYTVEVCVIYCII